MAALLRTTVSNKIVEDIKQRILSKEYLPGNRLPTERSLAENYQVSRIPVREALRSLEQMGLVVTYHGRGTFVAEAAEAKPIMDSFSRQLLLTSPSMMNLLKVRELLEKQAAMDAAEQRTEAEMETIRKAEKRCRHEIEKARMGIKHAFHEADYALHAAITTASHNEVFKGFLSLIHASLQEHQTLAINADMTADRLRTLHASVCEAIDRQDSVAAGAAMGAHMEHLVDLARAAQEKVAQLRSEGASTPSGME